MTPNPWEIVGHGLRQTAQDVGAFGERRRMFDDMVQRRIAAQQEAQRQAEEDKRRAEQAEREKQKFDAEQANLDREQKEKDRAVKVRQEIARGKEIPGKASGGTIEPDSFQPYTPEEANRMLLGSGDLSAKDYVESTLPPKPAGGMSFEERAELERIKAGLRTNNEQPVKWDMGEVNGRKVQINPVTGEQRDLGPVTPKISPKASENIKNKLQSIALAKAQLAKMQTSYDALKNSFSAGPGGSRIPTEAGKMFDADVDGFRSTLRSLTRTPGEGSMSDYEGKIAQAALPDRGEWEGVTQRKIDNLADQIALLENGYVNMQRDYESPEAQAAHAAPVPAPTIKPSTPQDKQAIAWARANPNDPRSKKILSRFGM